MNEEWEMCRIRASGEIATQTTFSSGSVEINNELGDDVNNAIAELLADGWEPFAATATPLMPPSGFNSSFMPSQHEYFFRRRIS